MALCKCTAWKEQEAAFTSKCWKREYLVFFVNKTAKNNIGSAEATGICTEFQT